MALGTALGLLIRAAVALGLLAAVSSGCSGNYERQEARRNVLRSQDSIVKQKAALERTHMHDEHGTLLESEKKVVGIVLPRGVKERYAFGGQHWYDAPTSLEQAAKYFAEHLDFARDTRPANGPVTFLGARAKGDAEAPIVTVTLQNVAGHEELVRIAIRERRPTLNKGLSDDEVQAQMRARAAVAE